MAKKNLTKDQEMQQIIRLYNQETGETEVDMHKVVRYAVSRLDMKLPTHANPLDLLATRFSKAARLEIRHDKKTGRPYRANHAVPSGQGYLWVDIDEAPRRPMHRSLINRREQIVGDALQLSFDTDHWNDMHPNEEPIVVPLDFTDDVEWRKNGPEDQAV